MRLERALIKRLSRVALTTSMLAAALPGAAVASDTAVFTFGVTVTGATTATVDGSVNPGNETTQYHVEYDVASSTWCMSGGGSAATSTTPQTLGFTDSADHDVSVALSGLSAGTAYCADLVATNVSSTQDGGQTDFSAGLPSSFITGAAPTGATTSTITGTVNPAGQTTSYHFEYDLDSSGWCVSGGSSGSPANSTAPQTLGFSDTVDHDVAFALTGLTNGTSYCGRIVASTASGSAFSSMGLATFQPSAAASTSGVSVSGATSATVDGSVNPVGQTTTFAVQYDLANSIWCLSDGLSGSPANSTVPQTLSFTDTADHDVSVDLSGLSAATDYCAALVARNTSGSGDGGRLQFTTFHAVAPTVATGAATGVTAVSATVSGTVDPQTFVTSYHFDYGTSTGYGATTATAGAGSWSGAQPVAANLSGLSPNTTYHYRLVATNPGGTTIGSDQTFTTRQAIAPAAQTGAATRVTAAAARIAGTVNPNGLVTSYHFEYETGAGFGTSTAPAAAGSGSSAQPVSATLSGLLPNTTYHYRLVAANAGGTTNGSDRTFTTATAGPPIVSAVALASPTFSANEGTTLRLTLSESARVTVVIAQEVKGHKVNRACKAVPTKGKSCTLAARRTSLAFVATLGRSGHKFSAPGLRPGHYIGTLTARDAAGLSSKPVRFVFAISKPHRAK